MKKFIIILFFLFLSSISQAHIAHYNDFKKIEMEIFRNGKLIGNSFYFFTKKGDEMMVTNQTKFSVEVLGTTIFKVEGYSEEIYLEDQLISFNSKTFQNDKEKFVNLNFDKNKNKFIIDGSSYNGEASSENIIGNWWNHKILQSSSQISPISGSIKEQVVTYVGKKIINQYNKSYNVNHFTLKSKDISLPRDKRLDFNVWYDPENFQIIKISYSKMGNWEYRLKNFE